GTGGGMQAKPMPEAPTMWLPYVEVDDVAKTMGMAKKLGARIVVDTVNVGPGTMGIFQDPTGAALGVWQSAPASMPARKAGAKKSAAKTVAKKKTAKKRG